MRRPKSARTVPSAASKSSSGSWPSSPPAPCGPRAVGPCRTTSTWTTASSKRCSRRPRRTRRRKRCSATASAKPGAVQTPPSSWSSRAIGKTWVGRETGGGYRRRTGRARWRGLGRTARRTTPRSRIWIPWQAWRRRTRARRPRRRHRRASLLRPEPSAHEAGRLGSWEGTTTHDKDTAWSRTLGSHFVVYQLEKILKSPSCPTPATRGPRPVRSRIQRRRGRRGAW